MDKRVTLKDLQEDCEAARGWLSVSLPWDCFSRYVLFSHLHAASWKARTLAADPNLHSTPLPRLSPHPALVTLDDGASRYWPFWALYRLQYSSLGAPIVK
jgi:hypothetical protein